MDTLKKRLGFLARPMILGFVFTFFVVYTAINYYAAPFDDREHHPNGIVRLLHQFHQVTIDWRLNFRGARKGSDQVIVLGIDEKALIQEGQWPWPRGKVKELTERLLSHGVKVVAFDAVWSEKEQNSTTAILEEMKDEVGGRTGLNSTFDRYLSKSRTDLQFGNLIEEYPNRLVMGAYFDSPPIPNFRYPEKGYQNLCFQEIHKRSEAYEHWENQEPMISVLDQTVAEFPEELAEVWMEAIQTHISKIEVDTKAAFMKARASEGFAHLSKTALVELRNKTDLAVWNYCNRWLHRPDHETPDENWEAYKATWAGVVEEDETLADIGFDEGVEIFKSRHKNFGLDLVGRWTLNTEEIRNHTLNTAYFNAKADPDGTVRRNYLMVRSGQSYFPSIGFLSYLLATNQRAQVTLELNPQSEGQDFKMVKTLELLDEEGEVKGTIPVDENAHLNINYAGPNKMFVHVSAADILNDEPFLQAQELVWNESKGYWEDAVTKYDKDEFLKDKIMIVGATAVGLYDLRVAPFEAKFFGVETHINVVDNLLRKDFMAQHPKEAQYMLILLLLGGILLSLLLDRFGALVGVKIFGAVMAIVIVFDYLYLFKEGYLTSIVLPVVLFLGAYIIITVYKYFTEEKNKKALKGTFGKYVSPAIVEEILASPENIELGGRKQEVTVFFSDVRGFTTISETLSATDLSDLLNEYLTPMTEIIFENKGTLDKYIGDAIMAFFGAPLIDENHAKNGCRAALQNIERLLTLQQELVDRGLPKIDVGIGLNTGEVSVGNMGSNIVRNYTIMGDSVNLGARLEGITKQYGVRIIISEFTKAQIGDDEFVTREVDWVRVKGKLEPVKIYELVAEGSRQGEQGELMNRFDKGFHLYHECDFVGAKKAFEHALEIKEDDFVSKLYIDRCNDYIAEPPASDWDGVFVMTTK